MTTDENLMLYTKLAGFRLVVLASRFGCDSDFLRELHDRLIEGLEAAIDRIHILMELERSLLVGDDEFAEYRLGGEAEMFRRFTINLFDELEIDFDTHEYRVNGGNWITALAADSTGVHIDYPEMVSLAEHELGALASIIKDIARETGIPVQAARAGRPRCGGS
ncbi:hypothetical protein [Rhizobium sp. NLR22b]|uniref:hypothetical protein n=1 Tax=Rhizobium sp. NLR22b TaxID=2731115 RepID=UPI001C838C43|nr:hypothetical protein [Rhizobium sp. NLR22b]MBX5241975.1 hypothetical protein [Rhizobium sp. NLR22b]